MVKYKVNQLYSAKLTKISHPEYAEDTSFITKSDETFVFEKNGNIYKEVFTETSFIDTVEDISSTHSAMVLIRPRKLKATEFKKADRKSGEVSQLQIVPVYNRINEQGKKLVKARAA